ncbi:MAG: WbuC family cupin fold metalloprotein [Betaproteobacteria bacterium]|nr:WbuC family cupin fold metalloprotein [Betaproteobacteria bacterium]
MTSANQVTLIGDDLLDQTSHEARRSARGRKNLNFHAAEDAPCNRLLNAVEPGSYVQPHRHLDPAKDETFIVLRGAFGLVLFDDEGTVTRAVLLRAGGNLVGANVPHGVFHTVLSFEPGSVFFESKAGPYRPLEDQERAQWAPKEGETSVPAFMTRLESYFDRG